MIRARALQEGSFKRCCMLTGELDGSDRDYFFQIAAAALAGNYCCGVRRARAALDVSVSTM
jgi:hypothetical protein